MTVRDEGSDLDYAGLMVELALERITFVDAPYYSMQWFRQCALAVLRLETRRSWVANAGVIADALIKRSAEIRSGEVKGMSAFFMPEESLETEDILRNVKFDKTISYMEMVKREKDLIGMYSIHPVDLALFCEAIHLPYLPEKPDSQVNSESRPTPAQKRGKGKKRSK